MEWFRREAPSRVAAVLPGAFNPPTRAHLALARAALDHAGEVVFVLPRAFPHKNYEGPSFDERLAMLRTATANEPRFALAACEGGLFLEIARELRSSDPALERILFLCGRDAAERIVAWDYGSLPPIEEQLREYELLVAPRQGEYLPPEPLRASVTALRLPEPLDEISSSEVRARIREGRDWRPLVPPELW